MKAIVGGAVVIAILLLVTIFVVSSHSASPVITARLVNSFRDGNATSATVEFTNHVSRRIVIISQDVEARTGSNWIKLDLGFQLPIFIELNSLESRTFFMTNLPNGLPLRMTLSYSKELTGMPGLFERLELRFRKGQKYVSLNPFDKKSPVFSPSPQFLSVDFVAPEPK